jgi:hypothetical protein
MMVFNIETFTVSSITMITLSKITPKGSIIDRTAEVLVHKLRYSFFCLKASNFDFILCIHFIRLTID